MMLAQAAEALLGLAAALVAASNLEDLAHDLLFLGRPSLLRAAPLPAAPAEPGWFAILVPAWREEAVIGAMLRRLLLTLDHPRFRLFVGTYPNDPATTAAAAEVAATDHRVQVVATPRAGPTTKADCLNRLWQAALADEAATGVRFKAVVLHDAEDVVHPDELKVFDALMPAHAMVQLPVMPIVDSGSRYVGGHYADEFAEHHAKDLLLRARLGAAMPSAGVGCAIGRDVLAALAQAHGLPFEPASLTEDYLLGHRVAALGGRATFARVRGGGTIVATREFFPGRLDAAARQKARWLHGIALDGWRRLGWRGGAVDRWMLWRDRKGLVSALLTLVAYGTALPLAAWALLAATPLPRPPAAIEPAMPWLLLFNALLMAWRLAMRASFATIAYGPAQGLRSVPRAVVGNLVNALAALRALRGWAASLWRGVPPAWDKTEHRHPDADAPAA